MPVFDVTAPDGKVFEVNVPEGAGEQEAIAYLANTYTPEIPVESEGSALADVPIGFARGAVQGVRFIADAFGADNPVSEKLKGAEGYLGRLMSAQSKKDAEEISRIMEDAEDKGVLDEVLAGIEALTIAPVDLITQAFGTAAPMLVGGLFGMSARMVRALGVVGGAGRTKGNIYEATKSELINADVPEEDAEARALAAQEYGGENLDQILLGGAFGLASSVTGIEKALIPSLARNIVDKAAKKSVLANAGKVAIGEAVPEALQAGQEQVAVNVALQRQGFDVPTFQGAAGAATLEGLVGGLLGAGVGAVAPERTAPFTPPTPPTPPAPPSATTEDFEAPPIAGPTPAETRVPIPGVQAAPTGIAPTDFLTPEEVRLQRQQQAAQQFPELTAPGQVQPAAPAPMTPPTTGVPMALPVGQDVMANLEEQRIARQTQAAQTMEGLTPPVAPDVQPMQMAPVTPAQTPIRPSVAPVVGAPQPRTDADRARIEAIDAEATDRAATIQRLRTQAETDPTERGRQIARETLGQMLQTPAQPRFIDLNAMDLRTATGRLQTLQSQLPSADLNVVPHPSIPEAFAIEERPIAPAPEAVAEPAPSFETERTERLGAQQRIEAAEMAGRPRAPEEESRQVILSRALQNIEERGGVASPEEAQIVQEAGIGIPFDRIDYGLSPQGTTDQRLTEATGIALQPRPREAVTEPARMVEGQRQALQEETERRAQVAPQVDSVIGALSKPAFSRTADETSTVRIARQRYAPDDVRLMEQAATDPDSLTPEGTKRLNNIREFGPRFSLTEEVNADAQLADEVRKKLLPALKRFGLGDVALKLVDSLEGGRANGSYLKRVITIALDSNNPLGVMRHEVIHALKELGAFTPAEWRVLTKRAREEWMGRFIGDNMVDLYRQQYLQDNNGDIEGFQEYIEEEAIAEAFKFFESNKPPAGMIQNLIRRLKNMFNAIKDFFSSRNLTAEDIFLSEQIFRDIERGAMTRRGAMEERAPMYSMRDREYNLELEKEARVTAKTARLTPEETESITKDAEKLGLSKEKVKEIIDAVKNDKKRFPVSAGWEPLKVVGIGVKLDDNENPIPGSESPKYQTVAYGYATPPGKQRAPSKIDQEWLSQVKKQFQSLVEDIYKRSEAGDKNAQNIIAHQTWYRGVTQSLRREYGAFGDLLADLLGATSPNTPVDTNWRFSIDVFRRFVNGDFDTEMKAFSQHIEEGKPISSFPAKDKIRQLSGKLYGMNSSNAMMALSDVWRAIKPGQAPKARNFALNLIGQSDIATIDVWAARMLRRSANLAKKGDYKRIPPPAETGVSGTWSADGSRITGEFGFGAEVMKEVSDSLKSKGIDVSPPDLQAIAWFAEKELWGSKGWTSKSGEGGSFEENIEKFPVERYVVGHSVQQGETKPSAETVFKAKQQVEKQLKNNPSVISFRVKDTKGLYGGTVEEAFDTEFVTEKDKFDPTDLVSTIAKTSKEENQYDFFVSKVIDPNVENQNARPGVEIYFKSKLALDNVMPILTEFTSRGVDGFTLALDPRIDDSSGQYIGIRLQFVPEISMRWDEGMRNVMGSPGALEQLMEEKAAQLEQVVAEIANIEEIAYASVVEYDTVVVGRENYDDYISPEITRENIQTGKAVWFGQSVREHVEAAIGRYTGQRPDTGPVGDAGETTPARYSLRPDQFAFRPSDGGREGISFNDRQPDAKEYIGSHYGNSKVNTLNGNQYGTGLKGAEAQRLARSTDPRIRKRVYFYIPRFNDTMPPKESGVGNFVYSQKFNNILPPGPTMSSLYKQANGDSNAFESSVIDAGYDGYAVPDYGMMVVLNNDVPVQYEGTASEVATKQQDPANVPRYSLRTKPDPEKTVTAYKLFRVDENRPGELFPLFIDANTPVPIGQWIDADMGEGYAFQGENGHFYIPSTEYETVNERTGKREKRKTGAGIKIPNDAVRQELIERGFLPKGSKATQIVALARRPGWHAGDLPMSTHLGSKSPGSQIVDTRSGNQVWAEVEMPADVDWQAEARKRGVNKDGKFIVKNADITDQIPEDGYYKYKTSPTMTGSWMIGGSLKVNRILSDTEVAAINEKAGVKDLPRAKPFESEKYGLGSKRYSLRPEAKKVVATEPFKRWFGKSKIVNADGTPKIMYHGTARDITEFAPKQADAIFVTEDPVFAESFTDMSESFMVKELFNNATPEQRNQWIMKAANQAVKDGNITKKEFNEIKREFSGMDITFGFIPASIEMEAKEILLDQLPSGANIVPVYVRAERPFDYANPEHISEISKSGNLFPSEIESVKMGRWASIEAPHVQNAIREAGFDGFYILEAGRKNLAIYNPNQVKSATGNIGTFDETGRIRYNLVEKPANAPPHIFTKTTPKVNAGKAIQDVTKSALDAYNDNDYWTQKRIEWVDKDSGLTQELKELPIFQADGTLRADMAKHSQRQVINLIKTGLVSGTPYINSEGTISIRRTEDNLARSEILADQLGTHPDVIASGLTGKNFVAEVARALRGADILAEDARLRELGAQQLEQAKSLYKQVKEAGKAGNMKLSRQLLRKVAQLRKEGYANKKMNRERQVTPEQIAWAKKQLDKVPQVQQILDIWKSVNNSLVNLYEESGILSAEKAQEYRDNKFYVPLFKSRDDLDIDMFKLAGVGAKTSPGRQKKLKGAEIERNIWENLETQYAQMTASAYENQTRRMAVQQLIALDAAQETNLSDPRGNLKFRRNGQDVNAIVENPNVLKAFQTFSYELGPIMKAMGAVTQVLRAGALINPMFWLRQLIRDPIHATLVANSGVITPFHAATNFAKVIADASPEARLLAERGVIGQVDSTVNLNDFLKDVGRDRARNPNVIQKALHKLLQVHEASDAATRVSVFKRAKEKALKDGMSEEAATNFAVYKARESINFAVMGMHPFLNSARQMIPFLNATIVGLDTLYKATKGYGLNPEERKEAMRQFRINAGVMVALSAAYAMMYQNDDDYKKLPDYVKDNNFLIPIGTGEDRSFIKLAIPYEVGFLFKTVPEVAIRYLSGTSSGKEMLASYWGGLLHNLPTGGTPIPQAVRPALEVITNHSFFTGRPIESMGESGFLTGYRGRNASEFAKMMSNLGLDNLGLSPAQIDYLMQGYFAELGTFSTEMTSSLLSYAQGKEPPAKNLEQQPFFKSFMTNPNSDKAVADFYEITNTAQQTARTFNDIAKVGRGEEAQAMMQDPEARAMIGASSAMRKIQDSMAKVRQAMRVIEASPEMSGEEKRERMNELTKVFNSLAQQGVSLADQLGIR